MSLLLFVFPVFFLILYLITYFWKQYDKLPVTIVIVGSLMILGIGFYIILSSEIYSSGTRIQWYSVSAKGEPLVIGGRDSDTVVGWTNGLKSPKVNLFIQENEKKVRGKISGGGAFLHNSQTDEYFNGEELKLDSSIEFQDGYKVSRKSGYIYGDSFDIFDKDDNLLATFSLNASRPRNVAYLIYTNLVDDLNKISTKNIAKKDKLLTWANQILIVKNNDDKVYILDANQKEKEIIFSQAKSENLILQSSKSKVKFNILADFEEKTVEVNFEPLRKVSSPLPPNELEGCNKSKDILQLTVATSAAPCETVFNFPFGAKIKDLRPVLFIAPSKDKFTDGKNIAKQEKGEEKSTNAKVKNGDKPNYGLTIKDCRQEKIAKAPIALNCEDKGVSQATVSKGDYTFTFIINQNSVNTLTLGIFLGVIWLLFICGLMLVFKGLPEINRWVIYGVIFSIWSLLVIRLMLAFRYVLDSDAFDKLAINGVTRSLIALAVLPGLFLLLTRLHNDVTDEITSKNSNNLKRIFTLIYPIVLFLAVLFLNFYTPLFLWGTLSADVTPEWVSSKNLALVVLGVGALIVLLIGINFNYLEKIRKNRFSQNIYNIFVLGWNKIEKLVVLFANGWSKLFTTENKTLRDHVGSLMAFSIITLFLFAVLGIIYWIPIKLVLSFVGADKLAQETLLPLFICSLVLFWIGFALALKSKSILILKNSTFKSYFKIFIKVLIIGIVTISIPTVFAPLIITDFGSIISILAMIIPLCAVLLASNFRIAGLPILLAFLFVFGVGYYFYQNFISYIPYVATIESIEETVRDYSPWFIDSKPKAMKPIKRAFARTLNFKDGSKALEYALVANRLTDGGGLAYQELLSGNEHIWESQAIAHEGKWIGLGYGEAPTRDSAVRQDTLQFDSVYGFFILSEYGFVGGVLLLLIYLFPLIFIFLGSRERFDTGYAFAFIITSALFIEALYHAGMNLAAFPMSGRNLPLLSVNSPSDLAKWGILLLIVGQAIFWRYEGFGNPKSESRAVDLISKPFYEYKDKGGNAFSRFWNKFSGFWFRNKNVRLGVAVLFLLGPIIGTVIFASYKNVNDKTVENFSYQRILDRVDILINEKVEGVRAIKYDGEEKKIIISPDVETNDSLPLQFLEEEARRFEAFLQDKEQKKNQNKVDKFLKERLSDVKNIQEYNEVLRQAINLTVRPTRNKLLFRLIEKKDENGQIISTRLGVNPAFNFKKSFKSNSSSADLPLVKLGDELIIGPSWSNNRIAPVTAPNTNLTWLSNAALALTDERKRLKEVRGKSFENQYNKLTLDETLQKSATEFVTNEGVKLHEKLLSEGDNFSLKLPSRIALSVITLPKGKTLALGSFPRSSTKTSTWKSKELEIEEKKYNLIIPATKWIETMTESNIRDYYTSSDHNFTLGTLMGSSTKPIFAAAVLKVHPIIGKKLRVPAGSGKNNSVFGLEVRGEPWNISSTKRGCLDFKDYLMRSDNNFHVHLGFLGLAVKSGNPTSRQTSLPVNCSKPWSRFPKFEEFVKIEDKKIKRINSSSNNGLATSEFAQKLYSMFGINVGSDKNPKLTFRRSFWTGNTDNDLNTSDEISPLFDLVSPQAPDFDFSENQNPRNYVTVLLGGGSNSFSNVDLAGSFGTAILGNPVIPHIIESNQPTQTKREEVGSEIALSLRKGLLGAVLEKGGTANELRGAVDNLLKDDSIGVYAKTGTLIDSEKQLENTSRIIFAIVKWKTKDRKVAESGLVFSLLVEQGGKNKAVDLLNKYIFENKKDIRKILYENVAPKT